MRRTQDGRRYILAGMVVIAGSAGVSHAQTNIVLPDITKTTTLTAVVAEQADLSLPAAVTIDVPDVNAQSARPNQVVTISNIVLASATKQLRLSIRANAATFTKPPSSSVTWNASQLSWTSTQAWSNAVYSEGTLSDSAFNVVATCDAGVSSCSTTRLKFMLEPNPSIRRSGSYTIGITWKIESI